MRTRITIGMDREDTERPYAALPLPRHGNGLRTGRGQLEPARGYPLRLNVPVAYDLEQLEPVPDDRSMAYVFRDPADRLSAVAAIINVPGAQQER